MAGRDPRRLVAAIFLFLAALPARAEFWEAPQALAEGRYPSFFPAKAGPVLIWQESQSSGEAGKAWIRFARLEDGAWKSGTVSDSAYAYNSSGSPPILYSAAQSRSGTIAVAIAASGTSIEIWQSRDGGKSFERTGRLESGTTSVAPRIFPSASGGWIVFATQGRPSAGTAEAATAGEAAVLPSSVSIYVAKSVDGSDWGAFAPLVSEDEKLLINFAPFSSPLGAKDIVLFQTFILGEGDLSSRYALMSKTSSDGGATWTKAKPLTDFPDPSGGADAAAQNYDNQGAQLVLSGGKLYAAWERHKVKSTQIQVWAAHIDESGSLDPKAAGPAETEAGSFMLSQLLDAGGSPALLAREDKLKANRVLLASPIKGLWASEDTDLAIRSDKSGAGLVLFARAIRTGGRILVAWQIDSGDRSRILAMLPDTSASAPDLLPLNFALGKRSRAESAQVRVNMPQDASGIKAYAYLWEKTQDKASAASLAEAAPSIGELWKSGVRKDASSAVLDLSAGQDGAWTLWASVEDNAGNRSPLAALSFYRKRIPPAAPIVISPDTDERGFLVSNTFDIRWIPPEADDLAGYSWDLAYAGPLEGGTQAQVPAAEKAAGSPTAAAKQALPGLSPYESSLVRALGLRLPPPGVRGAAASYSAVNVDNGYYLFSVSAIDLTGNMSGASSVLVKADKFQPYTALTLADSKRDDLGRTVLRILGRGFLADGSIERVAIDRDGREPYDIDRSLAKGDYRMASDREIDGVTFEDAAAGSYRIGLYHSKRGWYWTAPLLAIDSSGTAKYGLSVSYKPSFRLFSGRTHPFTIYDAMVLMAIAFAAVGILLSSRQVVAVAREGETLRREALALVTGGPMPLAKTGKAARALRRRSTSLRVKFTLIIAFLVIFVVVLLAVSLGYNMVRRTSSDLAKGLDQRARVLLESVAQGGRFFLGKEDAVTQLSLFPTQAKAMEGADYITISGMGTNPKVASGEVVYATSDDKIAAKLDPATLNADRAVVLGQSSFKAEGGTDSLAPLVAAKAKELQDKAAAAITDDLQLKVRLAQEKAALKADAGGNQRRTEINAELDAVDLRIRDKLRILSDQEIGSLPGFDPAALATGEGYLYYKPILEYRPSDSALYRGMVRLEVNTRQNAAEVKTATFDLLRLTLIIAAIALGIGIIGAFILSTVIVVPIRKLVAQIERIRDTEDKESLEGSKIEVNSRDELYTLADTVNQMTAGLVRAAKDSKELIVGKGIQKMFIPLDPAPGSKVKLSTGRRDEKDFEIFGYYEGAKGVSGDYWDFKSINSRYHYFIKCDISGKGVSAALIMVQVATMVISYFNDWKKAMPKTIDLTDLTYRINDFLEERQFIGRFAAFTLGVWDSEAGVAYLCEAGDRKLHVWEEGARRLVEELLPDSPAAGPLASFMVQMKKPFIQVTRQLGHGDALMLYTDGIEEAKRRFRDQDYNVIECGDVEKDKPHENHSGGQDNEEFGYDRITGILEAVASRGVYRLEKRHNPAAGELLSFDFSSCGDSLEDKIIALIAVEKVFRLYRDPSATAKDAVLVDQKIDEFLEKHFDQYRLYCSDKKPNADTENPGYLLYQGIREDSQYDDLTLLAIRRK
jgi:hypothetical protein